MGILWIPSQQGLLILSLMSGLLAYKVPCLVCMRLSLETPCHHSSGPSSADRRSSLSKLTPLVGRGSLDSNIRV